MRYSNSQTEADRRIDAASIVEICLCHHVRKASRAITRLYDKALQPSGLNYSQFNILAIIAALEPVSMTEVANQLNMDRSTLFRNLKPLKKLGFISGEGGSGRRPDVLFLNPEGLRALGEASVLWKSAQSNLATQLGQGRTGQLIEILGRPLPESK